jgi:hypothetical protein
VRIEDTNGSGCDFGRRRSPADPPPMRVEGWPGESCCAPTVSVIHRRRSGVPTSGGCSTPSPHAQRQGRLLRRGSRHLVVPAACDTRGASPAWDFAATVLPNGKLQGELRSTDPNIRCSEGERSREVANRPIAVGSHEPILEACEGDQTADTKAATRFSNHPGHRGDTFGR